MCERECVCAREKVCEKEREYVCGKLEDPSLADRFGVGSLPQITRKSPAVGHSARLSLSFPPGRLHDSSW